MKFFPIIPSMSNGIMPNNQVLEKVFMKANKTAVWVAGKGGKR